MYLDKSKNMHYLHAVRGLVFFLSHYGLLCKYVFKGHNIFFSNFVGFFT